MFAKSAIAIIILLSSTKGISQFKDGIIIAKDGRSYNGLLNPPERETNHFDSKVCEQKLAFKESKKSKKEHLTVNDIRAFKVDNDSFIVVKDYRFPLDDLVHNVFAEVLMKGK